MRDSHCHLLLGCDPHLPSKPQLLAPSRLAAWPHLSITPTSSLEAAQRAAVLKASLRHLKESSLESALADAWPQLPTVVCAQSAALIHALWPEFTLKWWQGALVQERLLSLAWAKASGVSGFCLQSTCCLDFLVTALTLKSLAVLDSKSSQRRTDTNAGLRVAATTTSTTPTVGNKSAALQSAAVSTASAPAPVVADAGVSLASLAPCCQLYTGIHPLFLVAELKEQEQELRWWLEAIVGHATAWNYDGIGEIGLDARKSSPDMHYQLRLLEQIMESTVALQLPYSFHCVHAHNELLRLLKRFSRSHYGLRGTIHGFNQNATIAAQYVELGFSLSLGAEILREHNALKFKQLVAAVPAAALVVETDFSGERSKGYEGELLAAVGAQLAAWQSLKP